MTPENILDYSDHLLPPAQRAEAIQAKRGAILDWLCKYPWTTTQVLSTVTGLGVRAVQTTLVRMERDQLVRRADIQVVHNRPVSVFGLSVHGRHMAVPLDRNVDDVPRFEPNRIAVSTFNHEIDVQIIHAESLHVGWADWATASQVGTQLANTGLNIPDGVAISPTGVKCAVEVERTVKSIRRYEDLLVSYLDGRKRGLWQRVVYLSPTPEIAARVERAYRAVKTARFNGKAFDVTVEHLRLFQFSSFDEFRQGAIA